MFMQLCPRGVILPLSYRNPVPEPSSVLTISVPERSAFHENENHPLSGHPERVWVEKLGWACFEEHLGPCKIVGKQTPP